MAEYSGRSTGIAAAVSFAALLVFPLSGALAAGPGAPASDAPRGLFGSEIAFSPMPARTAPGAEKSAQCGKCHSTCEYGKSHEGLAPAEISGNVALPLTDDGRATCFTCHEPHTDGASGGGLRISNQRRELCLACHLQPEEAPSVEIISPPPRAIVEEKRLALIGRAANLAQALLTVRLNGAEFHLHVKKGELATWISLQDGVNRIEIAQGDRLLWQGEVFHGVSTRRGYERLTSSHCTESREQCNECHKAKDDAAQTAAADASTLCYGCHDRFEGKRYLHGPLAVGACLSCHDPHGGYGTAHLRDEQSHLCAACHSDRQAQPSQACASPGKACADCHDPHQSDARYLLRGRQYTLRDGAPTR